MYEEALTDRDMQIQQIISDQKIKEERMRETLYQLEVKNKTNLNN